MKPASLLTPVQIPGQSLNFRLLLLRRRWGLRFGMASPIFEFFTGLGKTSIGIFSSRYIICIIAAISDDRFYFFDIDTISDVFDLGLSFFEIDIDLANAIVSL